MQVDLQPLRYNLLYDNEVKSTMSIASAEAEIGVVETLVAALQQVSGRKLHLRNML